MLVPPTLNIDLCGAHSVWPQLYVCLHINVQAPETIRGHDITYQ